MIDPRLRLLRQLAWHGTVTAAAAALHYTPSAASYQLRQLAEDLQVELLTQHGRGVRLTPAAHTLLRHTDILIAQAERARAELAATTGDLAGAFTLCGFSTAAIRLLPPTAAHLRDHHPHLTVRVIEAEPGRCFDLLLTGEADLGLVVATAATPPASDIRFEQRALFDDPLELVVPADHPLTTRDRVTLADAADEQWIVGRPEGTYHQLVRTACHTAGFTPNIAHHADEWDTGAALVAYRFGIILVPRLARLPADLPVTRLPLSGDPTPVRRILTITRRGGRDHPTVTAALTALDTLAADLDLPPRH